LTNRGAASSFTFTEKHFTTKRAKTDASRVPISIPGARVTAVDDWDLGSRRSYLPMPQHEAAVAVSSLLKQRSDYRPYLSSRGGDAGVHEWELSIDGSSAVAIGVAEPDCDPDSSIFGQVLPTISHTLVFTVWFL
jgi:hypothetical protein